MNTLKKLVAATLTLSLLGATAASARPYGGHRGGGYDRSWHGHRGNDGALIGLGIGLFALGAIAASQSRYGDRYYDRYSYGPPPPPPGYAQRYGYYDYGY